MFSFLSWPKIIKGWKVLIIFKIVAENPFPKELFSAYNTVRKLLKEWSILRNVCKTTIFTALSICNWDKAKSVNLSLDHKHLCNCFSPKYPWANKTFCGSEIHCKDKLNWIELIWCSGKVVLAGFELGILDAVKIEYLSKCSNYT